MRASFSDDRRRAFSQDPFMTQAPAQPDTARPPDSDGQDPGQDPIRLLCLPGLQTLDGLQHAITERGGGISRPPFTSLNLGLHVGDQPADVIQNRRRLAAALDARLEDFCFAEQCHGHRIAIVGEADRGRGALDSATALPATDALITDRLGLWLAVLVADCVPVILADPVRGVVGLVHAGWRGTVDGIAARTVAMMNEAFGCRPADIHAVIGPSIGPDDFEVGPEVVREFRMAFPQERWPELIRPGAGDRSFVDLWRANALQLEAAGLNPDHIERAMISTASTTERFFSHRAEGGHTGRFASVVAWSPEAGGAKGAAAGDAISDWVGA
jgi:YfiH family protein